MKKFITIRWLLVLVIVNCACAQEKLIKTDNPEVVGVKFENFRGSIFLNKVLSLYSLTTKRQLYGMDRCTL